MSFTERIELVIKFMGIKKEVLSVNCYVFRLGVLCKLF